MWQEKLNKTFGKLLNRPLQQLLTFWCHSSSRSRLFMCRSTWIIYIKLIYFCYIIKSLYLIIVNKNISYLRNINLNSTVPKSPKIQIQFSRIRFQWFKGFKAWYDLSVVMLDPTGPMSARRVEHWMRISICADRRNKLQFCWQTSYISLSL